MSLATYEQVNFALELFQISQNQETSINNFRLLRANNLITTFESYSLSSEFAIGSHLNNPSSLNVTEDDTNNTLYQKVTEARKIIKETSFKEQQLKNT